MHPDRVELVERLPYTPPLLDDELLSSWIARIEAYYLMHGALRRWLVRDVVADPDQRIVGNLARLFDIAPSDAMLARLGTLTRVTPDLLRSRTLPALYPGLRSEDFARSACNIPGFRASEVAFCAECAREMTTSPAGQYLRVDWALVWQTICPRHLVLLEDMTAHCSRCADFSPTLSHGLEARYICQACGRDRFDMAFQHWRPPRPEDEDDPRIAVSRFEQQTLEALSAGRGRGPWVGIRSSEPVRRFLKWFVDFTGRLERHPKEGASPMLRRMCPRLLPEVGRRVSPISAESFAWESVLVRQQLILALVYLLSSPSVKRQINPGRHDLIAKGFLEPETASEWLLGVAEAAIAGVPRAEIARFAPYPRLLVAAAVDRYQRNPRPFDERHSARALPILVKRPRYRPPTPPTPTSSVDWMTETERRELVDEFLQSEQGRKLLRMPPIEARRQLGRVARMLYEKHEARRQP